MTKSFGRGGFGTGKVNDKFYDKKLQRNRIEKNLNLIEKKLLTFKTIVENLLKKIQNEKNIN